jgi:hypothetical protein
LAATSIAACSGNASEGVETSTEPDQIGNNENPALLIPGASSRLADNISAADVGSTFGTDDAHIPYPDTYWPFTNDGIDARWSSGSSPLEKYTSVLDPTNTSAAKQWEHTNHGSGVADVQSWFGHCPGWTGAAMATPPIQHPVWAARGADGGFAACSPGASGCTEFEIGDINALAAEVYVDAPARFIGARCDTKPADIQRDADGRIVRDGKGCKGLNAGALLVVLGQQMKRLHLALAIDAQNDFNTDQIWNQPAYRYTVHRYQQLTQVEAANLVAHGTRTGDRTSYTWNAAAQGFVLVDITISWVSEYGPNASVVSGAWSTRTTRFVAVVELDAPPSSASARIVGGEYLNDSSAGADRLTVPPFVWIVGGPSSDDLPLGATGNDHNPYVKPSYVAELIQLGTSNAGPPAGVDAGTGSGGDACAAFGDCASCTAQASCGWCGIGSVGCHSGTGNGPTGGACGVASWAWSTSQCTVTPPASGDAGPADAGRDSARDADTGTPDTGTSSDPCASLVDCASCTAAAECGWCVNGGGCHSGVSSGPSGGQCSGANWAWESTSCR